VRALWHVLIAIPEWCLHLVIKATLLVTGLVVVPFMYRYRDTDFRDLPWWTFLWKNPEDWKGGVLKYERSIPYWWIERMKSDGFWAFYKYHAIRNPADGIRNIKFLQLFHDPKRIGFVTNQYLTFYEPWYEETEIGKWYWHITWQGTRCFIKVMRRWNQERYFVLNLGHGNEPRYAVTGKVGGVTEQIGSSVKSKFLPYRKY